MVKNSGKRHFQRSVILKGNKSNNQSTKLHWNELVKLALLGTDRSTLSSAMKAELQGYGIDTEKEITEVILESAALYAPLQKAGFQPKAWSKSLLSPSLEEELASCCIKSANHLGLILSGRYAPALTEFVERMADSNKCIPAELLPELLDKCVNDEEMWSHLKPIIGNRGNWLIQLNTAWQKLAIPISQEKWETGTREERIAILKRLRRQDPAKGLTMLLSTWVEDGLTEKAAFLKCLAIELSDLDEVFLEECLDFPRKEVRVNAAALLSQLPNSELQKRLYRYFTIAINIGKIDGEERLTVVLPALSDKVLIRNGINPKKKWKRGGAAASMLFQLVSILPPEKWEIHLQRQPAEILYLFNKNEWALLLVEGTAAAATLHESVNWMEAIVHFWLANYTMHKWNQLDIKPILDKLPNEVFNEVLYEKLKAVKVLPDEHSPLIQLLQKESYIWDDRLTKIVMSQLKEWLGENVSYSWSGYQYRMLLKRAAYNVKPTMEKTMSHFWLADSRGWAGWDKDVQQFLNILSFRKEMLLELEKK